VSVPDRGHVGLPEENSAVEIEIRHGDQPLPVSFDDPHPAAA
jgi:hypothetical protein